MTNFYQLQAQIGYVWNIKIRTSVVGGKQSFFWVGGIRYLKNGGKETKF